MNITDYIGRTVLVRDNLAGIHVGELVEFDPAAKCCTLRNARKVWYWSGAASCHGIAACGLDQKKSKVCPAVPLVTTTAVVEIVMCSDAGAAAVMGAPTWTP